MSVGSVTVRAGIAPMKLPLQTSTGAISTAPLVLIDLETSEGIVGRSYLFAVAKANLKPIVALVEDPSLLVGLSKGALIDRELFSPSNYVERIVEVYRR